MSAMTGSGLHEIGNRHLPNKTLHTTPPYLVKDVVVVMQERRRCWVGRREKR
jgi:urease accessory protein UreE